VGIPTRRFDQAQAPPCDLGRQRPRRHQPWCPMPQRHLSLESSKASGENHLLDCRQSLTPAANRRRRPREAADASHSPLNLGCGTCAPSDLRSSAPVDGASGQLGGGHGSCRRATPHGAQRGRANAQAQLCRARAPPSTPMRLPAGKGGKVVLWSTAPPATYGDISTRGGRPAARRLAATRRRNLKRALPGLQGAYRPARAHGAAGMLAASTRAK